ncbi:putative ubiquitin conjugating enzyme [Penicillium brasilianum]|uniref:Putative ubiquitin conjugating enzyme n=1 Tax=Penicillium brasilianum TaxID=104259 RepID=A0A1S9RZ51_PENBI|nr:putative ubiquitin conjugating enzyme [Penicillium brasilianum]
MPTKDFQRDLNEAKSPGRFPHLTRVRAGEGDGSISFTYTDPVEGESFHFEAIVADPHDYPSNHTFFVYSTSDNVPAEITKAVDEIVPQSEGLSIHDVLSTLDLVVSGVLQGSTPQSFDDVGDLAIPSDQEFEDDLEPSDWTEDEDSFLSSTQSSTKLHDAIRRDLRAVKLAGLKVGYHGDPTGPIVVSVAIRIARMGLSEEAMRAWNVRPADYLILLIRYGRYQTMEDLNPGGDSKIQMRVGLCDSYKPSLTSTIGAFQETVSSHNLPQMVEIKDSGPLLRELFIGASLDKLLNERFLHIARLRLRYGFTWTGAESFFQATQGKFIGPDDARSPEFAVEDTWITPAPNFLHADHMADMGLSSANISFPLVAELFLLRHFVKCTEFCLVCHCKTHDSFEALKPYVCSNGLCLFQYMTLGMGPSLEYEIRTQPYVVDMLISLAYERAKSGRLSDSPNGLGLNVPCATAIGTLPSQPVDRFGQSGVSPQTMSTKDSDETAVLCHEATLSTRKMELSHNCAPRVKEGNWIAILNPAKPMTGEMRAVWHCRVLNVWETSGHVALSRPVSHGVQLQEDELGKYAAFIPVQYVIYDMNFDMLPEKKKQSTIIMLLDNLPDIDAMQTFLGRNDSGKLLSSWHDMISPAALDLLRWIVASNRSCILQDGPQENDLVSDMKGFIQFRLVQGAPDKEHRFMEAVNQHAMRTKTAYPTIFAWHGSPLHNWHSILREGLHFKDIAHGRAFGNGVYLSNHYGTSAGYAFRAGSSHSWAQSKLKIQSMISLNEIVNNPAQFVATSPHYVVQHLDWIQPRYLFVQVGNTPAFLGANVQTEPPMLYAQDPKYKVLGLSGKVIQIPMSAFSSKRREALTASPGKSHRKKKRTSTGTPRNTSYLNDTASVSTDIEDLMILLSDAEQELGSVSSKSKKVATAPKTDFIPGTLQEASLPLISPPAYATSAATALLQRHLQTTLKIQEKEPLDELGWYVDPSLIRTVYQWIVELHTFDPTIPLAKDLKAANLTSVVLEVRFPPNFPMDPPFVRVIRPRFLEFALGGGGHVTAGGAICMELLTNSGWSAANSIESLLLQVRLAISTKDHPARLAPGRNYDYSVGEAIAAYTRACIAHGWAIPKDLYAISR